jgi:hypothetical protein
MREIKFRAWHIKERKMYFLEAIDMCFELVTVTKKNSDEQDYAAYFRFSEIELMQYASLKDKNGVEIYEGDILELRANSFDRKKDLFQVVFKDGGFRDEWNNYIGQYLPPDIRNKQGGSVRLNEACEVVGNIYENPELLR